MSFTKIAINIRVVDGGATYATYEEVVHGIVVEDGRRWDLFSV